MNNPYQTPNSELGATENSNSYKSLRWKVLFFILLPLEIWSQYDTFTVNEDGDSWLWRICMLVVYTLFFVGLHGLAFKRAYFTNTFWKYFLPVLILLDCTEVYNVVNATPSEEMGIAIIVFAILMPLIFITWYSIYKYSKVLKTTLFG